MALPLSLISRPLLRLLRRHPFLTCIVLLLFSPSLLRILRSLLPLLFCAALIFFITVLAIRRYMASSTAATHCPSPSSSPAQSSGRKTWMWWMKGLDEAARAWMEEKLMAEGIPLTADANKEIAMALLRASFGEPPHNHILPPLDPPTQKNPSTPPSAPRASSSSQNRRLSSGSSAEKKTKLSSPSSAVSCRTRASTSSSFESHPAVQQQKQEVECLVDRSSAAIAVRPTSKEGGDGVVKKVTFAADSAAGKGDDTQQRRNFAGSSPKQLTTDLRCGDSVPLPVSRVPDVVAREEDEDKEEWCNPFDDEDHHDSSSYSSSSSAPAATETVTATAADKTPLPASAAAAAITTPLRFSSLLPKPSSSPANKLLEASRRIFQKEVALDHSSKSSGASPSSPPPQSAGKGFAGVKAPSSKRILEACRRFSTSSTIAEGASTKEAQSVLAKAPMARKLPTTAAAPCVAEVQQNQKQPQPWSRKDKSEGEAKKKKGGSGTEIEEEMASSSSSSKDHGDHGFLSFKKPKTTMAARNAKKESGSTFLSAFK